MRDVMLRSAPRRASSSPTRRGRLHRLITRRWNRTLATISAATLPIERNEPELERRLLTTAISKSTAAGGRNGASEWRQSERWLNYTAGGCK